MPGHDDNFQADQKIDLPIAVTQESCANGTFIVTGANTGLGYEAAKHYVTLGSAKVILAVRSLAKGEEAKAKIEADTGITGVAEVWQLDLSSYDSVMAFVEKVDALERIDAIIENAGVALDQWSQSDGLETTLMVNVTATLLLAALVLPKLKEAAERFRVLPHITFIGSGVAFSVPGLLEKIPEHTDILQWLNNESNGMQGRLVLLLRPYFKVLIRYIDTLSLSFFSSTQFENGPPSVHFPLPKWSSTMSTPASVSPSCPVM
jgi:hypothetical protein